ncbi:MAG: phosphate ABC transporter permease PstA [Dehalococcoidales bacterium]|nr:phosphate ABC transporter permease PstA [Dehalococcoidales bacterium]
MFNKVDAQGYYIRKWTSRITLTLCTLAAGIAVILLLVILGYTLINGISYINIDFLVNAAVPAGESGGGMKNEIIGTVILTLIASVIALPVGLMAGTYLSEFGGKKMASSVRFAADILAGVPSIVVGVFAYAIVVRPLQAYSALSAGIALAVIMIPMVTRTTEESIKLVPNSIREAALALGIPRWRTVLGVIMPGAITGIITGIMLGVARIAGETAPLIFTAFGNYFGFDGLLKPIAALPLQIYKYAISAYPDQNQQAWAGAFLLVILILIISIFVRWLSSRRTR